MFLKDDNSNVVEEDGLNLTQTYIVHEYGHTLLASKGEHLTCILFQQDFP